MLPQPVPAAEQRSFDLALRQSKALGYAGDRVQIPVPADKDVLLLPVQSGEKAVDGLPQGLLLQAAGRVIGGGNALLQLGAELGDEGGALEPVPVPAAVENA